MNNAIETGSFIMDIPSADEFPRLLELWETSVRATHHFLKEEDIVFFRKTIQDNDIFSLVNLLCVRDRNGMIHGFMGTSGDSLEMIFLAPEAMGKGVGRALLTYAMKELKVTRVDVNEQNLAALSFYEHFGFKVMSRSDVDGTGKPYPILHMHCV